MSILLSVSELSVRRTKEQELILSCVQPPSPHHVTNSLTPKALIFCVCSKPNLRHLSHTKWPVGRKNSAFEKTAAYCMGNKGIAALTNHPCLQHLILVLSRTLQLFVRNLRNQRAGSLEPFPALLWVSLESRTRTCGMIFAASIGFVT